MVLDYLRPESVTQIVLGLFSSYRAHAMEPIVKQVILCCACAAGVVAQVSASAVTAAAKSEEPGKQTRIAFADMGGIGNWRADDGDVLFVQSRKGQWYRADLLGSCTGLPFAHTIGFVFEPSGSFDRFSSIVVDGRECRIRSLVESTGPADTRKSPQTTAADAKGADHANGDASIPFVNLGGIENWRAVDADTLYIEGRNDQWYRAELRGSCPGMRLNTTIGFVTRSVGSFDEFSSIVVDGRECHLQSLTESPPPPDKES